MHYIGHRERLRTRFLENESSLQDYEILELVLFYVFPRRDVKKEAKDLLAKFGNLHDLLHADLETLKQKDLSERTICIIKLISEINIRNLKHTIVQQPVIDNWQTLQDYCREAMGHSYKEQLKILYLNGSNMLIADESQTHGTVNQIAIYTREVVKRALELTASSVIIVHNHPSGIAKPSKTDIAITKKLKKALEAVDIVIYDHLIVTKSDTFSFKENGII